MGHPLQRMLGMAQGFTTEIIFPHLQQREITNYICFGVYTMSIVYCLLCGIRSLFGPAAIISGESRCDLGPIITSLSKEKHFFQMGLAE